MGLNHCSRIVFFFLLMGLFAAPSFASPSFASTFILGTYFQFQNPYFLFMLLRSMLFIAFCPFLLIGMQMVSLNLMLLQAGIYFRLRKVAFSATCFPLFAHFQSDFVLGSLDCDHNNAFFCDPRDSSFYSFVMCPILFELTSCLWCLGLSLVFSPLVLKGQVLLLGF